MRLTKAENTERVVQSERRRKSRTIHIRILSMEKLEKQRKGIKMTKGKKMSLELVKVIVFGIFWLWLKVK